MLVHAVTSVCIRRHPRQLGGLALLRRQHLEAGHGPHRRTVPVSGGLCGQGHVLLGVRGVSLRIEGAVSQ